MCTIGCVKLESVFIFKNRDPIRGTPLDEWIEKYPLADPKMLIIRNSRGCYGGINFEGVGAVGTFVNMIDGQNNYFDGNNLITILDQGDMKNIYHYLVKNPLGYFGNMICSDGRSTYSFELNGGEVDCLNIAEGYVMTNHFQRINKSIRTIGDPFIAQWTCSRLDRGKALIKSVSCLEDIEHLLSDHNGNPDYSICNHGKIPTASSYIIDCTKKTIYYCSGCPCENTYVEYTL